MNDDLPRSFDNLWVVNHNNRNCGSEIFAPDGLNITAFFRL